MKQQKKTNLLIRPVTKAMLVAIFASVAYAFATKQTAPERRYFEADASGRLVQVEGPSNSRPALRAIWKPEPSFLLSHRSKIGLRHDQIQSIGEIDAGWASARAMLERQMEAAAKPVQGARSVAAIRSELNDYSELSRAFGNARDRAWSSAVAVLDPQQQKTLTQLVKSMAVRQ